MINFINKNRRVITIIFVLIVVTLIIFSISIWRLANREPVIQVNDELIEITNLPIEYWLRKIDIEKTTQDTQIAKNDFDGYQITVPADWHIEDTASPDSGLQIVFQVGEIEVVKAHFEEGGLVLKIFAFDNPKQFDLISWLTHSQEADERGISSIKFEKMNIGSYAAYKRKGYNPLTEEVFSVERGIEYIPIEDTLVVQYFLGGKNKIFSISCIALSNIDTLIPLCEKQIQTFKIL